MTGSTFQSHLPYPEPTDPLAQMPTTVRELAESVFDAGSPAVPVQVAGTGFSVQRASLVPVLGDAFYWLDLQWTRTGADITAPASGNLGDVTVVALGPAGLRPLRNVFFPAYQSGIYTCFMRWSADGNVTLTHATPAAVIGTGTSWFVQALVPRFP